MLTKNQLHVDWSQPFIAKFQKFPFTSESTIKY